MLLTFIVMIMCHTVRPSRSSFSFPSDYEYPLTRLAFPCIQYTRLHTLYFKRTKHTQCTTASILSELPLIIHCSLLPLRSCLDKFLPTANYPGPDKALHIPDVRLLAKLAEQAGLDLRILVLVRKADEILRSTVYHRNFGTESRQASILGLAAATLTSQLQLIDPRFFVCVNMSQSHDSSSWEAVTRSSHEAPSAHDIANGVGSLSGLWNIDSDISRKAAGMLAESKAKQAGEKKEYSETRLSPIALNHLAAMNDLLLSVCGMR